MTHKFAFTWMLWISAASVLTFWFAVKSSVFKDWSWFWRAKLFCCNATVVSVSLFCDTCRAWFWRQRNMTLGCFRSSGSSSSSCGVFMTGGWTEICEAWGALKSKPKDSAKLNDMMEHTERRHSNVHCNWSHVTKQSYDFIRSQASNWSDFRYNMPTTMFCYCTHCQPTKEQNRRTIKRHLKSDLNHLASLLASGSYTEDYIAHVEMGISKMRESLASGLNPVAGLYILLS